MYERGYLERLSSRMREPRHFLQVVMGPRQVGKTTLVKQLLRNLPIPYLHYSADNVAGVSNAWISQCWASARQKVRLEKLSDFVLVIDEIQKIRSWSECVKKEWDEDTFQDIPIKAILLGSSRVMLERGLADSLAGRFERIVLPHWSYPEMRDAFGFTLEDYVYYGGYPGAAPLVGDVDRWSDYISGAIVDATINKDILNSVSVTKPAVMRQAFELASCYSGQELALTKITGQIPDAGNATTLAGYLGLLSEAGLVCGLRKYARDEARKRNSVPKFQVYNNALKSIYCNRSLQEAVMDRALWGRLFESAIGAHVVSHAYAGGYQVFYWRDSHGHEVDYVLERRGRLVALEVKSNEEAWNDGLSAFREAFHPQVSLVIGKGGLPAADFLGIDPAELF